MLASLTVSEFDITMTHKTTNIFNHIRENTINILAERPKEIEDAAAAAAAAAATTTTTTDGI
jgi:hypothetical protein